MDDPPLLDPSPDQSPQLPNQSQPLLSPLGIYIGCWFACGLVLVQLDLTTFTFLILICGSSTQSNCLLSMDAAKFRNYFESIEDFFTFDNWISWSEKFSDIGDANNETESGRMFNLSFQMVTSRRQDIIKREINMLESTVTSRIIFSVLGYISFTSCFLYA
ncbi:hypothetical protein QL285_075011 [Trifolium repens]|nr:hypothetical protein QL285_075011 [Trifolium repens]